MSNWISVQETLPESRRNILFTTSDKVVYPGFFVFDPGRDGQGNHFKGDFVVGYFYGALGQLVDKKFTLWEGDKAEITHWQAFPDAP
jgi:hypothetical protein